MTGLLYCEYVIGVSRRKGAHTEAEDGAEDEGCAALAKLHDSSSTTGTYRTATG
jgi:hypothetical protein